jgi:epoxyqueuosine reductase
LGIRLDERHVSVIIPPTYSTRIDGKVERMLKKILEPAGYKVFRRSLPLKLLTVRSGLARYGRNNLAYVKGMGSYCRLLGFYTSLHIKDSIWKDPQPLEECEKCVACIKKCPTNAIDRNRFLIRAERCLTFHNERAIGFPKELHPEWHHCLIGCLYCQTYCPINKKVGGWIDEYGPLEENDTAVLLAGGPPEALSKSGRRIMDEFGFTEELSDLSRNLKALLSTPGNIKKAEKLLPKAGDGE